MTARAQLLQHIAQLSEEDIQALLPIAERLRAKHLPPAGPEAAAPAAQGLRHPERFGALAGSVRHSGDVESPVIDPDLWTADAKNLGL